MERARRPATSRRACFRRAGSVVARARWPDCRSSGASPRRGFQCGATETVAQCFAATPRRAFAAIWEPLVSRGARTRRRSARSAQVFARRAACRARRQVARQRSSRARRSTFPRAFPTPRRASSTRAAAACEAAVAVRAIDERGRWRRARDRRPAWRRSPRRSSPSDRISLPRRSGRRRVAEGTLRDRARAGRALHLRIDHDDLPRFSARVPFMRTDAAPRRCARPVGLRPQRCAGQARRQRGATSLIAVVISASGPHDALDHASLARERRIAAAPACPRPARGRVFPGDRRTARDVRVHAWSRAPAQEVASRPASTSPATTPTPSFRRRWKPRRGSGVASARALIADFAAGAAARGSIRAP